MKNKINEKESNKNSITNDKSISLFKLNFTEHYKIDSKNIISKSNNNNNDNKNNKEEKLKEKEKIYFINDYYINEEKKNSPKISDGKELIHINDIMGEVTNKPITLQMIDTHIDNFIPSKLSSKSFGYIKSYAVNTNQGIVRDYNEDRVSIVINMNKPEYYNSSIPWPKISYFGIFDGHAGNKCADFLRDNLLEYIVNNQYFPSDIPNAIKIGFKNIDEYYLKTFAFIDGKLVDNSGSCALILIIMKNIIYIANVGDSRCVGSFQNGKLQKDITIDHKPNSPEEKERIMKYGGSIYQTQTPLDDELYKNKILIGPYRVTPGKLSVSRTVGDAEGKIEEIGGNKNILISSPDIYQFNLDKDDIDFFLLGCDGIFDQLTSKEAPDCAWNIINNNIDILKNKKNNNVFKGNYGNEINLNTTSGNVVDLILKASMIRKSFDNITCLFISFKDFFCGINNSCYNYKVNNTKNNIVKIKNKKLGLKDLLFKNNSHSNTDNNEKNVDKKEITNDSKQKDENEKELKKIISEPQFINKGNKDLSMNNKDKEINKEKEEKEEEKKELTDNKIINNNIKMSENNILKKNNDIDIISKTNEKKESIHHNRSNSFVENNNNNLAKINQKNNNKNFFYKNISSINFFSKNNFMGFNIKKRNKKNFIISNNKIISNFKKENTPNNNTDTKRITELYTDNPHNLELKISNDYNYPKITNNILLDYKNKNKKNEKKLSNTHNDIRSNSYNNIIENNKKPKIELIKDKNFHHNKLKIKFSNIIKENYFEKKE